MLILVFATDRSHLLIAFLAQIVNSSFMFLKYVLEQGSPYCGGRSVGDRTIWGWRLHGLAMEERVRANAIGDPLRFQFWLAQISLGATICRKGAIAYSGELIFTAS